MKAILILLDSLNRDYLSIYGNRWVKTPNLDTLARRSVVFENHYLGSAPCMPARRDMLTGRLGFLERDWGGIEPFDVTLPQLLRGAGVHSHMETDHYHYFHVGGENYHSAFDTWAFHRGQELDAFVSNDRIVVRPDHLGGWSEQYERNRATFNTDADYPTPRTFSGAAKWLRENRNRDNYFLWVEAFDPHEPFDCPPEFVQMYDDEWRGPHYNWSGYERVDEGSDATLHLQRQYAATLTMADKWLGILLDEIERQGGYEDTLIIVTSDHGHLVGERGRTGKRRWHVWNELARLPLLVHLPGSINAGQRRSQLTQNIDILPTVADYFSVSLTSPVHGLPWTGVLLANGTSRRTGALYGWFGQSVNVTDGRYTYFRAAARSDNQPLFRYFLTPTTKRSYTLAGASLFHDAQLGRFLPYTDLPVIRARVDKSEINGCDTSATDHNEFDETMLFDLENDPGQTLNVAGTEVEARCLELLVREMRKADAPPDQFERLGLPDSSELGR